MSFGYIPDNDNLFRHSLYPIAFKGKTFASSKIIKLYDQPDGSLLGSLAWERFAPTAQYVHDYGCRLALNINNKSKASSKKSTPNIYCGAYRLEAKAIRSLVNTEGLGEIQSANVVHHIENGEIAHTDLVIRLKSTSSDIEGTKTAIIDRLWNKLCHGPLTHICDCDRDVQPHPNTHLEMPPAGAYLDTRTPFSRRFDIVRFTLYRWIWSIFYTRWQKLTSILKLLLSTYGTRYTYICRGKKE